ncbi:MAG: ATP-dependent DNA helicase RecG [Solirubrobacterales bacterium]
MPAAAKAKRAGDPEPPELPRGFGADASPDRAALLAAPLRSWPRPSILGAPLTELRGAGPKLSAIAAEGLGIETLGDLLLHLPHAHRDAAEVVPIGDLRLGEVVTVEVEVSSARLRPTRRRGLTIVEAKVSDESGAATAIWFNQAWLAERLSPGTRLLLQGTLDKRGFRVAAHELLGGGGLPEGIHTKGVVPVHPASEGLKPQKLREWIWQALALARHVIEPLPARLRTERGMPGVADALHAAHFPPDEQRADAARRRLAFEELLLYQAALAQRRSGRRARAQAVALGEPGQAVLDWIASLPFELTGDQQQAIKEIDADLAAGAPMQRLLMGEVGSGKTVVALYAMLRAVEAGHQAALMAPTETLAEQHFATLQQLLADSAMPAALLTGAAPADARRGILGHLASGQLGLIVGTHALIEGEVAFRDLALAVVDEQHRFGVRQRAALDAKGPDGHAPHTLHMTATPIPRTLSLTAYGDLDTTALRELPAGRMPIATRVVAEEERPGAYDFVRDRLREGRQAYVVCPLVIESEKLQARAATEEAKLLAATEFKDFSVDVLHGQMPSAAKAEAMSRFVSGATDLLVATSVIEVGIDVRNATVMVIEAADRYGLSQLHQLRGRVGRGEHASACILFAEPESKTARARLEAIATESDGFRLAEVDLALRGEGEILGTRQHGLPRFAAAELPEDTGLLLEAREQMLRMLRDQGSLEAPELGPLLDAARWRFGDERTEQVTA